MFKNQKGELLIGKIVSWSVGVVILLVVVLNSLGTVPAGYVGVKTRFSAVSSVISPGFYFKVPFVDNVITMDTQTQKEQVNATAASNDLQQVTATVAINFHVNPEDAGKIYQSIGADYQVRVIDPAIQESIKSITANYTAEQLITQREKAREEILTLLTSKLQTFGVNADSLNIVNFEFSQTFNTAIEAKVTAEQNALAAKNKLSQVQYEAQQRVAEADGEAKAIAIQAQAITSQGGAEYVKLQGINKWDGKLPNYMLGNSTPFINLNQ